MKKLSVVLCIIMLALGIAPMAFADDGVAGCSSVKVNPEDSMEFQHNICQTAEGTPETSCAAGGHGSCSSPKMNDVLPEADHCICISEVAEAAPDGTESASVEEAPAA